MYDAFSFFEALPTVQAASERDEENMTRRPRVALHGAVYGTNFGDVLIQRLLAQNIRALCDADVFYPFGSKAFGEAADVKVGSRLNLVSSDAAVFGPGGYFGERAHHQAQWNKRLTGFHGKFFRWVKVTRTPLLVAGVGVGPLGDRRSRSLVSEILSYACFIQVRDRESKQYAIEFGIEDSRVAVSPDWALSLADERVQISRTGSGQPKGDPCYLRTVGLHISIPSEVSGTASEALCADIVAFVESHPEFKFLFLSDNRGSKHKPIFSQQFERSPNVEFCFYHNPDKLIDTICLCDAIVTTKLHVGICAAALGILPISVYHHHKVYRFYAQIGLLDCSCALDSYQSPWLNRVLVERLEDASWVQGSTLARHAREACEGINHFKTRLAEILAR